MHQSKGPIKKTDHLRTQITEKDGTVIYYIRVHIKSHGVPDPLLMTHVARQLSQAGCCEACVTLTPSSFRLSPEILPLVFALLLQCINGIWLHIGFL